MAAPHVAGAVALLKGAMPGVGVGAISEALAASAARAVGPATGRTYPRLDILDASGRLLGLETGWWWNATEPGTGVFVEVRNGHLFLSAYAYREDGSAAWYIASGPYVAGVFEAPLAEYASGQPIGGAWQAARLLAERGRITLRPAAGGVSLVLPNGREVTLTRFSF
jgi:hypothetical protein